MGKGILNIVLLFIFLNGFAQKTITVLNKNDHKPVPEAYIIITDLHSGHTKSSVTDKDGTFEINNQNPVVLNMTHLGFKGIIDTLVSNGSKTYFLEPLNIPLDQVVVTAQYTPDDPRNSVYQVKVIKAQEFEKKGATNLKELLSQETNIRIAQDNILGSSLSMQGLTGEQIKILVDGVPVIGRVNGNIDISQLPLNDVKRVEIIEGPMSVQYGTNALGGVINIITNDSQEKTVKADVNGYYESVGVYDIDGGVGFKKNRHHLDLTGGRYFFGGYSEVDSSRSHDWKPREQYFGNLKYIYSFKNFDLTTKGSIFSEKITNRRPARPPYYINAFNDYYYTKRYDGAISLKGKILTNHYLNQLIAYSYYSRIKNTYFKDLVTLGETMTPNAEDQDTSRFDAWVIRGFISRNKPFKLLNYQVGYDINLERGWGKRIENEHQTIGDYAVFGSFNIKPVEQLSIQAGLRWSYNTRYKAPVTPSINFKFKPVDDFIIRLSYARGFRAPSLKELYFYFVDVNHNIKGNTDLNAEYSNNLSLFLDYSKKHKQYQFGIIPSFFFNDINNLITLAQTENGEYTYINVDNYQTLGTKLEFQYGFAGLLVTLSGSYTGRKYDLGSNIFTFSPEASAEVSYLIPKAKVTVSLFNKFNGTVKGFYLDENNVVQEQLLGSYNLMDVSLSRSFWEDKIGLTIGAKNLFDVNSVKSTGFGGGVHSSGSDSALIAWGRSFFASLKLSFGK